MSFDKYIKIFEALDNEKRVEVYHFILQNIIVSKSDLAKNFNLKRASLNHHLSSLLEAGLVYEKSLFLEGRQQTFIIPAVEIHPERLIEQKEEYQQLAVLLDFWSQRDLNIDTWQLFREELEKMPANIINALENLLFPTSGRTTSARRSYCNICHIQEAQVTCQVCKHLVCQIHSHEIKRDQDKTIFLCSNCLEKFFG